MDFTQLTGTSVAGLAVYLMFKLVHNHSIHMTKALKGLEEAIRELIIYIKK